MAGAVFGREREQHVLRAAIDDAAAGRGTVVHVVGEPGIGKTALCDVAVAMARERGAGTARGRAVEGAPAFWPWRAVVPTWPDLDGGVDRFELFEGVLEALAARASTSTAGLLVVLDDLHWADDSSLRLVEHVAGAARDQPLVLVATSRRRDPGSSSTFGAVTATLARLGPVLELDGLGTAAVGELAVTLTGSAISDDLAAAVVDHTSGNPFFVEQVLRLVGARDGDLDFARADVPAGVDAVVRQRVGELGDETGEVLAAASVLGRTFDLPSLRAVLGDGVEPDKSLEEAVDAGLLAVEGSRSDRLRFVHAIVRDAVHASIPLHRRAEMHERAYRQLVAHGDTAPATLLGHAEAATARLGRDPAVRHAVEAAEAAARAQAFEEALRLVERAIALDPGEDERHRLLLTAGSASFHLSDHEGSTRMLLEAADRAEARGAAAEMADALLAVGGSRLVTPPFSRAAPHLRRALDLLGASDPGRRADVLSRLADFTLDPDERRSMLTTAVELARDAGDGRSLGVTLGRLVLHGVSWMALEERLAVVEAIRAAARDLEGAALPLDAEAIAIRVLCEAGDLDGATRAAAALAEDPLARVGSFEFRAVAIVEVLVAIARGELDRAQQVSDELQVEFQRRGLGGTGILLSQQMALQLELGRAAQIVALLQAVRTLPDFAPFLSTIDLTLAYAVVQTGDPDAASAAIDAALAHDLEVVARDWAGNGVASCGLLAEAMWLSGRTEHAARLTPLLEPVADRNLVIGMLPVTIVAWATHPLGLCALMEGRFDDAARLLGEAVARHRSMGSVSILGRSLLALAEAEVGRLDGDAALAAAREAATILGSRPVAIYADRARALMTDLGGDDGGAAGRSDGGAPATTTTFVFTDIVNSTAQAAAAGDEAWLELLHQHTSVVRALAVRHGGRVVKGLGDGFFVTFPSAAAGLRFGLAAVDSTAGADLAIRVGVHTGEAQAVDGDHLGHDVNLAARVAGAAAADEMLVSDVVARLVAASHEFDLGPARTVDLKGIPDPQIVHTVRG